MREEAALLKARKQRVNIQNMNAATEAGSGVFNLNKKKPPGPPAGSAVNLNSSDEDEEENADPQQAGPKPKGAKGTLRTAAPPPEEAKQQRAINELISGLGAKFSEKNKAEAADRNLQDQLKLQQHRQQLREKDANLQRAHELELAKVRASAQAAAGDQKIELAKVEGNNLKMQIRLLELQQPKGQDKPSQ